MIDAFNIMQDRITRARLAGDPPDVLISPKLRGIGVFEFTRAQDAIALGAEAAERALESITESVATLM
jgi:NTE family protein